MLPQLILLFFVAIPLTVSSWGMKILDELPIYDELYVSKLFDILGENVRDYYLYRQLPLDFLYPILFALIFSKMLGYFIQKLEWNKLRLIRFIPIMAVVFGCFENISILIMFKSYPNIYKKIGSYSEYFQFGKNCFNITLFNYFRCAGDFYFVKNDIK